MHRFPRLIIAIDHESHSDRRTRAGFIDLGYACERLKSSRVLLALAGRKEPWPAGYFPEALQLHLTTKEVGEAIRIHIAEEWGPEVAKQIPSGASSGEVCKILHQIDPPGAPFGLHASP